ncbi:Proton pump-interactor 1 [Camellia lanceoleosa]|uniref:Proton pump-interactor 1 n=1 Tax=Camellia lanceoleosa TaxID=1840588 RepID=A0ACC0H1A2_9ERIC|nr:Proton pump-interactor 1 [Camellia lanceoleosa]
MMKNNNADPLNTFSQNWMQMNMEVLEADFMQMALKEEIEAQNNCLDDEKEFGPLSSSRDDHHLIQVNFTKDIHDTEKLMQKKNEAYSQIAKKLLKRTVKSLNYQMQHGSNNLAEEKKLLREIKQNEAKMDNIKLNNNNVNPEAAQIRYYLGSRKDIQDHIQLICNELKRLRKDDQKHTAKIEHQKRELKAIERDISSLQNKLVDIKREKYEAYECILQLKKKGDDMLL